MSARGLPYPHIAAAELAPSSNTEEIVELGLLSYPTARSMDRRRQPLFLH